MQNSKPAFMLKISTRLVVSGAVGTVAGTVAWLIISNDRPVRPWLVIALVTAGSVIVGVIFTLVEQQPSTVTRRSETVHGTDVPVFNPYEREIARLNKVLGMSGNGDKSLDRDLQELLAGLVIDRLRSRRHLDAVADPQTARRIIGDDLWLLTTSPMRSLSPPRREQVAEWLARIEAI